MSRATDLRDAIVAELATALTPVPVRSVVLPSPKPEELDNGPVLTVRVSNREIEVDMGRDDRNVFVMCALFGMVPSSDDFQTTEEARRKEELEYTNTFDQIVEDAIDLWTPQSGALRRRYLADHRFNALTQTQAFDADLWNDFGIWGSAFMLSYIDERDN